MNCDSIARAYRWIEYAAFGLRLERHRFRFLPAVSNCRYALLLGEGDGRFVARLAAVNPTVQIDCVELSRRMVEVATERLRNGRIWDPARIRFKQGDVRRISLPKDSYDLIVTNFLLDCFSVADVSALIRSVRAVCVPGARWVISEFQQPPAGWRAWHAALWLKVMYSFFGLVTKLGARRLPPYEEALEQSGFTLHSKRSSMFGLIRSEIWILPATTGGAFR